MAHVIRLRTAWQTTTLGDITHHTRAFGRPRMPDPSERVWLVCAKVPGRATVSLNGIAICDLGESGPFAADITDLLVERNTVLFAVASPEALGDVVIEIRAGGVSLPLPSRSE